MPIINRRLQSSGTRHRGRESTASTMRNNDEPVELPDYEPLSTPLSAEAVRALIQLSTNNKDTRKYEEQLNKSIELLSASVRDLNDKHVERKDNLRRFQEKRGQSGSSGGGDSKNDRERAEEKAVLALKNDVPRLTDECDVAVRSVIDLKVELEDNKTALQEMARKVESEARIQRARRDNVDDDDMADADIVGPISLLGEANIKAAQDYASKSLYEKYGVNNDYIGFKRLWHDAVHGADGKPLPDASKWFSANGGDDGEDDDDDLIVAEEHLDIHCPLSMAIMQDPYTSTVCKHTFERDSIVQFLRTKPSGRACCPQTGCNKDVTIDDFHPDPVMLRRIKRRLAMERDDDDDDEEEEVVDGDGDSEMKIKPGRKIKSEREDRGKGRRVVEEIEDDEDEDGEA
ncbi:zinc-finger of the MIZ type in Nse subunit-domain-containing protein [Hypoxylon sp. FL1857]|nr:zinc-finger of the MIZ type in Nse subunit-domain-containing protein [Hypoxylon sp. FL1857]